MGVWGRLSFFLVNLFIANYERCGICRSPERVKDDWLFESFFIDVF